MWYNFRSEKTSCDPILSASFTDKLKCLIETSAVYHFPEDKMQSVPDFTQPVTVDLSKINVSKRIERAWKRLHELYDVVKLEKTFNWLNDEYSKEMFLRVIVYAIFDKKPLRYPKYYSFCSFKEYNELIAKDDVLKLPEGDFYRYNLRSLGYDMDIYSNSFGIHINFAEEQYAYRDIVTIKKGDYIIDGGSCYGDTALSFACKTGPNGKIFAFEFIDESLEVFSRQMEMNPHLASRIQLHKNPLNNNSSEILYSTYSGAGSYVTSAKTSEHCKCHKSVSIDDIARQYNIRKIDFIKLDIEGSELKALQGAYETIKRFSPQLAICVYHKFTDLWEIPSFIKDTLPDYKLYLDHHTIMPWETVLYATV